MVKLYLMRHGQTLFNTQGRVQGACDSPLTKLGVEQALLAKSYFEQEMIVFDRVYSSTQERATDTAKLVTNNQEVQQLKGLKEMDFGSFEAQPEYLLPKFRQGANSFEDLLVPYGGEDIKSVGKRVKAEMISQLDKAADDTVLMVSHGAAMWGLCLELGISFSQGIFFTNCAICEFNYEEGSLILKKLIQPTDDFKTYTF
ncbi:histidine phosphatase family protein [Streptococcus castoreus]|uniref:histidine phosphatase family protein n=1 Tax=Streptococcus castoreus TaxID=254786 RepID=UPI0003F54585|nr:histidine phosphatase family protein [Streptococcus castoreus]